MSSYTQHLYQAYTKSLVLISVSPTLFSKKSQLIGPTAAYFVERVVDSYECHYSDLQAQGSSATNDTEERPGGKETANLLVLLSELYNFQVISCVLIYDVVRAILDKIPNEMNVELLLKVIRSMWRRI